MPGISFRALPHRFLDLLLAAAAFLAFLQLDVNAHIPDRPGVPGADGGVGMFDLRDFLEGGQDRLQPVPGFFDGGVGRGLEIDLEFPGVEFGKKFIRQGDKNGQTAEKGQGSDDQGRFAVVQGPGDQRPVAVGACGRTSD